MKWREWLGVSASEKEGGKPLKQVEIPDQCYHRGIIQVNQCTTGHFRIPGIGLGLTCNGGLCEGISLKRVEGNLYLKRLPRISVTFKLVPVRYREYENGLFAFTTALKYIFVEA